MLMIWQQLRQRQELQLWHIRTDTLESTTTTTSSTVPASSFVSMSALFGSSTATATATMTSSTLLRPAQPDVRPRASSRASSTSSATCWNVRPTESNRWSRVGIPSQRSDSWWCCPSGPEWPIASGRCSQPDTGLTEKTTLSDWLVDLPSHFYPAGSFVIVRTLRWPQPDPPLRPPDPSSSCCCCRRHCRWSCWAASWWCGQSSERRWSGRADSGDSRLNGSVEASTEVSHRCHWLNFDRLLFKCYCCSNDALTQLLSSLAKLLPQLSKKFF